MTCPVCAKSFYGWWLDGTDTLHCPECGRLEFEGHDPHCSYVVEVDPTAPLARQQVGKSDEPEGEEASPPIRPPHAKELVVASVCSNGNILLLLRKLGQLVTRVAEEDDVHRDANGEYGGEPPNLKIYMRWGDDLVQLATEVLTLAAAVSGEVRENNREHLNRIM